MTSEYKDIPQDKIDRWYDSVTFDTGITAIGEPYHQEEVYCYFVYGTNYDVLIDTGMGVKPIKPVINSLRLQYSAKPLIVINTHWHFDHIGGNKEFGTVWTPKNVWEASHIQRGWTSEQLARYGFAEGFTKHNTPSGFTANDFYIPGYKDIQPVLSEGFKMDLGNHLLEVIETPGHTPGSISLYDHTFKRLYTSDLLYNGPLYAFEAESSPEQYLASLRKLKSNFNKMLTAIHPGHNYAINDVSLLDDAIQIFERIESGDKPDKLSDEFPNVVEYHIQKDSINTRLKVFVNQR